MRALPWLLALLAIVSPPLASACSCGGVRPLCQIDFDTLDVSRAALFIGRVKSVSPKSWEHYFQMVRDRLPEDLRRTLEEEVPVPSPAAEAEENAFRDAAKQVLLNLHGDTMTPGEREAILRARTDDELDNLWLELRLSQKRVEVEVQEVFTGEVAETVVMRTGMGGGDCGVGFDEGEIWLIDAHPDDEGRLGVSICSRTQRIHGTSEDVEALRAWKQGRQIPRRVYGTVQDWTTRRDSYPQPYPSAAGIRLVLKNEEGDLETVTSDDGTFLFDDLEAAAYRLDMDRPGWHFSWTSLPRLNVDLAESRCAELFLTIQENQGIIRGRLLPHAGEEQPEFIWVEAIPVDAGKPGPFDGTAKAPDGRFEIDEIEPGDYYVAINVNNPPTGEHNSLASHGRIWPYPPTYYPGVSNPSEAAVFHVERDSDVDLGEWTLPPRLAERRLSGIALRPDGSPTADARVILTSPPSKEWVEAVGPTGPDGRFEVHVLETISYELRAAYYDRETNIVFIGGAMVGPDAPETLVIQLEAVPDADMGSVLEFFGPAFSDR